MQNSVNSLCIMYLIWQRLHSWWVPAMPGSVSETRAKPYTNTMCMKKQIPKHNLCTKNICCYPIFKDTPSISHVAVNLHMKLFFSNFIKKCTQMFFPEKRILLDVQYMFLEFEPSILITQSDTSESLVKQTHSQPKTS